MEALRETATIGAFELRRTLKSARIVVFLSLYGMFSLMTLLIIGKILGAMKASFDQQLADAGGTSDAAQAQLDQVRDGVLGGLLSSDEAMLAAFRETPMVILLVFKITLFFLPLYIGLMGFDQTSGEVGPRSIRYLVVRARRASILLGKFASQAILLLGMMIIVDLFVFGYAKYANPEFTMGDLVLTFFKLYFATAIFSLSYVALTALCSALFRTPIVSLVVNVMALLAFWLLNAIGSFGVVLVPLREGEKAGDIVSPLAYLRYVTPSHYATDLLHPSFSHFGVSALAYAGFTLLFLGAGYAIFRVRDL